MGVFSYSRLDFVFTCFGLLFLLLDIGLDIGTVVTFYQEKAYVSLGLLLLFLLGSSALVQAFSWLWYSYEDFQRYTRVEQLPSRAVLGLLHLLQLGIYFRLCRCSNRLQAGMCFSHSFFSPSLFVAGSTLTFYRWLNSNRKYL